MKRVALIGMSNPYSSDPRDALRPDPPGCTGWKLWKMLEARTGATQTDYLRAFQRYNLCTGRSFITDLARDEFKRIEDDLFREFDMVVLLGAAVRRAIGLKTESEIYISDTLICIPHPSGRNLWYNDKINRGIVEVLLEDLYTQATT